MPKELFAREALAQIPKILTLLDRNVHSPSYGCFDRNFWHYRIIDFPSGMAQEFVWPLALAYLTDVPGNSFYQQPALRAWVEAGILYAARSAHPDGSCDDYFPYERAAGAAAFSLLAGLECYILLGLQNEEALRFFEKRADWLAHHHESGRLTNHQALIVLCLERLSRLLQTGKWDRFKAARLEQVLAWQSSEGWFQEYEGFDPGYQTLTISLLAQVYELNPNQALKDTLVKAVELVGHFIHPDGSYGGEYASRNTYNYFPHGFELIGRWLPEALSLNDRFLEGLARGLAPCYSDDHIIGHHAWNYLLAWRDFVDDRPPTAPRPCQSIRLKEAQILIDRRQATELYLALNKGGVFKIFHEGQLAATDTQLSLLVRQGRRVKNAVGHLAGDYEVEVGEDEISVRGSLGWAKQAQMTTLNLVILRLVMASLGRFFPTLVRRLLQRLLITGKQEAPFRFQRRLKWHEGRWHIKDELQAKSWDPVVAAGIGSDQTSIYVVMSRTFQAGQLQSWLELTGEIRKLSPGEPLIVERQI